VWKDPELTQKVPVRPDGRITLPLIGELQVSGLTAMNVQLLITQRLSEFIARPIVAVSVLEMRSRTYTIVGKIIKPGSYDLGKPITVLQAIAIAGGFVEFAKTNKVYILRRQGDGTEIRLPFNYKKVIDQKAPDENVNLKNGDTIVVP
jgi:polysaccharide export outer membrane protein